LSGVGIGRHSRDALIEIEQWQLKWSCHAQKTTLDIEIVPMGDEAASRRVVSKACGIVTNGLANIVNVVDAGTGSQKNVEKSLTGRAQRDDRRASADAARGNAIDTNKYVSITKLTRVKMFLSIAQQHQATHSKVIRGETKTNDDRRRHAREVCKVQVNVDEFTQTSSGERA
jgi:hypothetical protein